ncbi:unnamed protein product [Paramecium octaurelia]|uniref:Uncharacterized protein n=1 Tax=Paramecium octaurelia TaxID=43137 RepID=A0A8S1Y8F0_PAROT|nr:unnamed protein product [Paramecium octaurelia]
MIFNQQSIPFIYKVEQKIVLVLITRRRIFKISFNCREIILPSNKEAPSKQQKIFIIIYFEMHQPPYFKVEEFYQLNLFQFKLW